MKKVGVLIFGGALIFGLIAANVSSFGRVGGKIFNFDLNFGKVKGSGNVATDVRDVTGFTGVKVGGIYHVEIVSQSEFRVEIEADDNLLGLITTDVRGGILRISTEKKMAPKSQIRIKIHAPDINELDVSGVANVSLSNVKNESLAIESSGASKVTATGETAKLNVDISGASKVDAEALKAVNGVIETSGASKATVDVTETLKASASGASKIYYVGEPASIDKKSRGSSSVSPK